MMPIAPLMIEHRLIERMIALMGREAGKIRGGSAPDTGFLLAAVDFIRTYADRLHHGKEEDILFKTLAGKQMEPEHKRLMDELIHEHVISRENTRKLDEACGRYDKGDKAATAAILEALNTLAGLYPKHIEKEDKRFFRPVMKYLSRAEQDAMLAENNEFDRRFIHVEYKKIVSSWEKGASA